MTAVHAYGELERVLENKTNLCWPQYTQYIDLIYQFSDPNACFTSQVFSRIKECIEGRVEADTPGSEASKANHILDKTHTHIGIGMYVIDNRLRYVEVRVVDCEVGHSYPGASTRSAVYDDSDDLISTQWEMFRGIWYLCTKDAASLVDFCPLSNIACI